MDRATCSACAVFLVLIRHLMALHGTYQVPRASPCKSSLEILHCTDQAQRHDFKHNSDLARELEACSKNKTEQGKNKQRQGRQGREGQNMPRPTEPISINIPLSYLCISVHIYAHIPCKDTTMLSPKAALETGRKLHQNHQRLVINQYVYRINIRKKKMQTAVSFCPGSLTRRWPVREDLKFDKFKTPAVLSGSMLQSADLPVQRQMLQWLQLCTKKTMSLAECCTASTVIYSSKCSQFQKKIDDVLPCSTRMFFARSWASSLSFSDLVMTMHSPWASLGSG